MVVREFTAAEYPVVCRAMGILENVLREPGVCMTSPTQVREYLQLRLGALPHEGFMVLFLDSLRGLIEARDMFRGDADADGGVSIGDRQGGSVARKCGGDRCAQSSVRSG